MKNHIFSIIFALFFIASCTREEPIGEHVLTWSDELDEIIATASPTKVMTEDGVNLLWEKNDAIGMRYQQNSETTPVMLKYTTVLDTPSYSSVFKKDANVKEIPNKIDGNYIAVYPAEAHYIVWSKRANVVFAINNEQIAKDHGFDPSSSIMIASSDDKNFTFSHVVSYVKFKVTSASTPFTKITVTSGNESQYMVSRIRVNFDEDFSYSLEYLNTSGAVNSQTKKYVSLTTEDSGSFKPGTYYIAINPATYSDGLNFTFENEDNDTVSFSYAGTLDLKPGRVIDIGTVGVLKYPVTLPYISIYKENNTNLGVVFYEDPNDATKKKVISAASTIDAWATSNDIWRISNYKNDYDYVHTVITSSDLYKSDSDNFPAVKFCDDMSKQHGGNWHVPSVKEMNILFNAYYGKPHDHEVTNLLAYTDKASNKAAAYFDELLDSMGGRGMLSEMDKYWLCAQNSNGNVQYVTLSSYTHSSDDQTSKNNIRCVRDVCENEENVIKYPQTGIGKLLKGGNVPKVVDVLYDETFAVTSGLDYYKMNVVTDADENQNIYLLRIDPSMGLELKVAISDKTTSTEWHREKLSEMAAQISTTSNPLYGMINADFVNNNEPINPRGPVHSEGKVWFSIFDLDPSFPQQGLSYVGITYDGKMTIDHSDTYESAGNSLRECTGAGVMLVYDSKIQGGYVDSYSGRDPRTAIGYTPNNIIWMLVVDGRHGTTGMTYAEMASIFNGLGCVAAVNLDGGGSSEMLVRNPETNKIEICNWPSDPANGAGGEERPRLSAWAIVKK